MSDPSTVNSDAESTFNDVASDPDNESEAPDTFLSREKAAREIMDTITIIESQ